MPPSSGRSVCGSPGERALCSCRSDPPSATSPSSSPSWSWCWWTTWWEFLHRSSTYLTASRCVCGGGASHEEDEGLSSAFLEKREKSRLEEEWRFPLERWKLRATEVGVCFGKWCSRIKPKYLRKSWIRPPGDAGGSGTFYSSAAFMVSRRFLEPAEQNYNQTSAVEVSDGGDAVGNLPESWLTRLEMFNPSSPEAFNVIPAFISHDVLSIRCHPLILWSFTKEMNIPSIFRTLFFSLDHFFRYYVIGDAACCHGNTATRHRSRNQHRPQLEQIQTNEDFLFLKLSL